MQIIGHGASGVPSVLICDLDMPGIDGADFCADTARARGSSSSVPRQSAPEEISDLVAAKQDDLAALRGAVQSTVS